MLLSGAKSLRDVIAIFKDSKRARFSNQRITPVDTHQLKEVYLASTAPNEELNLSRVIEAKPKKRAILRGLKTGRFS